MGFLPDADHFNVVVVFQHADSTEPATITWSTRRASGIVTAEDVAVAATAAVVDNILASMDNNVTLTEVTAAQGPTPSTVIAVNPSGAVGTDLDEASPSNTALLMHKRTGFAGRRNRGRLYVPWYLDVEALDEVGRVTPALIPAIQGQFDALLADLNAAQTPMFITHSAALLGDPIEVTSLVVDPVAGTQRRRMRR